MHYLFFALTLLVSSSMLFVVQPMVAKMIQPVLGGSPAVWNTSMVFFQAMLLLGYLYAHLSTRWLGVRRQSLIHLFIMGAGLLFLPVLFDAPADPAAIASPSLWLLTALILGVGWPFFVISTSAPLLQKWFSTMDHPRAGDPYHLYAASNVGSFLALLSYPFFIEPRFGLAAQSTIWMAAYLILFSFVAICAALLWKSSPRGEGPAPAQPPAANLPLSWLRRIKWVIWAVLPSSMMLAVTTFITTDVAPVPLLWIPPLAIYLFSFILVFSRKNPIPSRFWSLLFAPALIALAYLFFTDISNPLWLVTAVHFGAFFVFSMVFHGFLADDRPHTADLTEFYLWMSVGGVLGGAFIALAAPLLFDRLLEYPLLLVLAALATPAILYKGPWTRAVLAFSAVAAGTAIIVLRITDGDGLWGTLIVAAVVLICLGAARFAPNRLPSVLAAVALSLFVIEALPGPREIHAERSFFAHHHIRISPDGEFHILSHGTTVHGSQARSPEFRHIPRSYYHPSGPLGDVFEVLGQRSRSLPIAAVGLGTGAIAAYAVEGQDLDIFEIDASVERIARNPDFFTYLEDCAGHCEVILGDGRLQMAQAEDHRYGLIVLDAYTSSAIPVHLLTRQALILYLEKLHPQGILAFHISNRHLDLELPLARLAEELGLAARIRTHYVEEEDPLYHQYVDSSQWLVMARRTEAFGALVDDEEWEEPEISADVRIWTDDYANVLGTYRF